MSVDKAEIQKFDKLADKWWDEDGEFAALHEINPLRLRFLRNKVEAHYPNQKPAELTILDIGCGGGLVSIPLARIGYNVHSVDASSEAIEVLKAKAAEENIQNLKAIHAAEGELPDQQYDIVVCLEVIEHVADLESFMDALTKRVKKGGMVILSTINRNPKSYMLAIAAAEYILRWVPRGTHEYSKFVKPSELYNMLSRENIYVEDQQGIEFNPISRTWKTSNSLDVNYLVYGKKR